MSICPLPWNHLATHPQGGVSLCCRVDYTNGEGMSFDSSDLTNLQQRKFLNLNETSIEHLINSDSFKKARLKMLSGQWPSACLGCKKEEDLGLESKRLRELKNFPVNTEILKQKTKPDGTIPVSFDFVELRLGHLCNLKCRSCNPASSSKWIQEYEKLKKDLSFVRSYEISEQYKWPEKESFWNSPAMYSENLKLLFINGGEPTLIEKHWSYLEKLIELNLAHQIELKYNINMTHLPAKAEEIWKSFKHVLIGASVDDLGENNHYLRFGAPWAAVEKNLQTLRQWGIAVAIEQTVSAMNLWSIAQLEKYAHQSGVGFGLNFVYDPEFLDPALWPDEVKKMTIEHLAQSGLSSRWLEVVAAHLKPECKNLNLIIQFWQYTRWLDRERQQNFDHAYPEFVQILKKCGAYVEA